MCHGRPQAKLATVLTSCNLNLSSQAYYGTVIITTSDECWVPLADILNNTRLSYVLTDEPKSKLTCVIPAPAIDLPSLCNQHDVLPATSYEGDSLHLIPWKSHKSEVLIRNRLAILWFRSLLRFTKLTIGVTTDDIDLSTIG